MRNSASTFVCLLLGTVLVSAMRFTGWAPAVSVETIPGTDAVPPRQGRRGPVA